MAFAQVTKSYGSINAGALVLIRDANGLPATILSSSTGGFLSADGRAYLDGSGNLSVYVDNGTSWTYTLITNAPKYSGVVYASVDPQNGNQTVFTNPALANANFPNYTSSTSAARGVAGVLTPVAVTGSRAITVADDQRTLDVQGAYTLTLNAGTFPLATFGGVRIALLMPATGTVSIASDGTVLLNGATTTVTKTITSPIVWIYGTATADSFRISA